MLPMQLFCSSWLKPAVFCKLRGGGLSLRLGVNEPVQLWFFVELVTQWSSDPIEINSTAMRHVVKRWKVGKSSTGDRLTRKDWLPKESNRGPQEKYLRSSL